MSLRDLFNEISRPASPILSLKDGDKVQLQFVLDFEDTKHCKVHQRIQTDDGFKNYRCVGKRAGCTICDAKKPSTRIFFIVKDLTDGNKVKIFPLSPGRNGINISLLNEHYDESNTIKDIVWNVSRTGEGVNTTYTFRENLKKELNADPVDPRDLPDIDAFIERTLPESTTFHSGGASSDTGGFPNLV